MTKSLLPHRDWRMLAAGFLSLAMLALAGIATPAQAYDAVEGAVALDPFDPVPEIQFRHYGGNPCFGECRRYSCYDGCYRYRRWPCDRDCERYRCDRDCERHRPCEHDCAAERDRRYDEQADRYDAQSRRYEAQARWYEEEVIDRQGRHHYNFFRDDDRRDGHFDEHHDGDGPDGARRDGDVRDGPGPDGAHHDGDGPGGDHHDGDPHAGDHHDDAPHDGIPPPGP